MEERQALIVGLMNLAIDIDRAMVWYGSEQLSVCAAGLYK